MIRIKESTKQHGLGVSSVDTIESFLVRKDRYGNSGMQLLNEKGIELFQGKQKASIGISKHGNKVEGIPKSQCILFKTEPPIYNIFFGRNLGKPRFMKKYKSVLSTHILEGNEHHFNIPIFKYDMIGKYFDKPKENLLCMVLKNKGVTIFLNNFYLSLRKYNKFSLMKIRERADKNFCDLLGPNYRSYGRGWDERCFSGSPVGFDGYCDVVSNCKFNFCPENSMFPGYVTEKPIHSMLCGSIPIYIGAPDVYNFLPHETFIDYRHYTPEELVEYIKNMSDKRYRKYKQDIKKFLESDGTRVFTSVAFGEKLLEALNV